MDALPPELLAHILRHNVGVSTYVACSAVSKTWREACRSDADLLRAVADYAGGLTRGHFAGLMGLKSFETIRFPHLAVVGQPVGLNSVRFYLYRSDAITAALEHLGGVSGWRLRLATDPPFAWPRDRVAPPGQKRLRMWELEERHHTEKQLCRLRQERTG